MYMNNNSENIEDGVFIYLTESNKIALLNMFKLSVEHNIFNKNTEPFEKQLKSNDNSLDCFLCLSIKEILTNQINYLKNFQIRKISNMKAKMSKCWYPSTRKLILNEIKKIKLLYNTFIELENVLKL